uniref:Uncharacterized protein n=1 Tax=Rhizophora mucronata TaxID=61149 RepID=A0A2P2PJJ5_RHIMU
MGVSKPSLLLLLLIVNVSASYKPIITEGRTISLPTEGNYSKTLETLGVLCKCCDGANGECTRTWTGSCNNLQCLPWKMG